MKILFKLYRTRPLLKPTVYLGAGKLAAAVLLSLLWVRFIDGGERGAGFAMEVFGLILVLISWFYYLGIDGVAPFKGLFGKRKTRKNKAAASFSMSDFIDEDITPYRDLEPEERTACQLVSGLLSGLLALILGAFI